MMAVVSISMDIAAMPPRKRLWRWYVILPGPIQKNHIFAHDSTGSLTLFGAVCNLFRHGIPWLIKAWRVNYV